MGGPKLITKIRLRDVPDLSYFHTDQPNPRGEIQMKSKSLFSGYFMNEEKTKETFTEDGWVNSGDVGEILPHGAIKIIDRVKNIFKLS